MKKFILLVLAIFLTGSIILNASTKVKIYGQSALIWRGYVSTNKPTITPSITYKNKGFQAEFWSAVASDGSYHEFDFILAYQYKNFKISLFDYYLPKNGLENKFFYFQSKPDMRHDIELAVEYKISDKFPLTIMAGNVFLGDYNANSVPNCEERYSTYLELNYPFVTDFCKYKVALGGTPYEGAYADKAQIVNATVEAQNTIQFEKFTIPWKLSLIYSTYSEDLYFVGGLGIQF